MLFSIAFKSLLIVCTAMQTQASPESTRDSSTSIAGDCTIRAKAGDSEIVVTTTSRLAGAIHSLTWNGKEFIDSLDHGRQLQSASNLDVEGVLHAETFNPTEAGAERDMDGPTSSSRLLWRSNSVKELFTINRMAFWLRPGQSSGGFPAMNSAILSNHLLMKEVSIGEPGLEHAIRYTVGFVLPADEAHQHAVFESLTGYMPREFDQFFRLQQEGSLEAIDPGPGEQPMPIVVSTQDHQYAMGVYSPSTTRQGSHPATYGRWKFEHEKVSKWNCVFRESVPSGSLASGIYRYDMFVAVGTLETVRATLTTLMHRPSEIR